MHLSVIIPTYNEEKQIGRLIRHLKSKARDRSIEILVIDAGSTDDTLSKAIAKGAAAFTSPKKGRAGQMNYGASRAKGDVLFFVHADTLPPDNYFDCIAACLEKGVMAGSFRFKFASHNPLLNINSWFTRFKFLFCCGGDQTLFISRSLFEKTGGYSERFVIMEEYELIKKLKSEGQFIKIPEYAIGSDRKYRQNSYLTVNFANLLAFTMYRLGFKPSTIRDKYNRLLNLPKKVNFNS